MSKLFGRKWYRGKVAWFEDGLYHITYRDGDEEDLNKKEVEEILYTKAQVTKKARPTRETGEVRVTRVTRATQAASAQVEPADQAAPTQACYPN